MTTLDRITFNQTVMGGKPCIRGMRVTVGTIVGLKADGVCDNRIMELYPYLEAEDIRQAMQYASWRTQEIELSLATV